MTQQRRYTASLVSTFRWSPPRPDAYASSASLTIHYAAGASTNALAHRTADEISAITFGRRRITIAYTTDFLPPGEFPCPAWVAFGGSAQIPIRILRVVSTDEQAGIVFELSEPLPHDVEVGGVVDWQVWRYDLTAPALVQGPVRWSVQWAAVIDGDSGETLKDEGVLWIVRAPFSTGLTHQRLVASSPWLANIVPPGQSSWAPQIDIALDSLVTRINARLDDGDSVNDVTGGQFRNAHSLETRLWILRGMQDAGGNRRDQIEQVERDLTAELDRIFAGGIDWIDADGDGVIDAGEGGVKPGRVELHSFTNNSNILDVSDSDAVARTAYTRRRADEWGER